LFRDYMDKCVQYLVHVFFHLFLPGVLLSRLTYIEKESMGSKKVHEVKKIRVVVKTSVVLTHRKVFRA
jgi:hypothetical protein